MFLREKLILVDCDGVLVDWIYGFQRWMTQHGYTVVNSREYNIDKMYGIKRSKSSELIKTFNESAAIGWLPQFRDSVKYVRKLHEDHGFIFHCITSLSKDEYAGKLRRKNLEALFGKTVFEKIECLDCGADKDEALEPYRNSGCLWVEDKMENCDVGLEMGLDSILIAHEHNISYNGSARRVTTWKEIYDYIT